MPPEIKEFILGFIQVQRLPQEDVNLVPLQGDGSKRTFWRIEFSAPESNFIAMANPPAELAAERENSAYLMIGKHLHSKGVPVPEIYTYDLEQGWFLMQDLGDTTLQDVASSNRDTLSIYEDLLEHLLRLQIQGARDFDPSWCCQTERYDHTVMRRYEADYFKHAFLHLYLGLKKDWPELEAPFNHLAKEASVAQADSFIHRDFQSRNIMISKGNIGIVDWQGGRLGPLGYDLASLLIDPYSDISSLDRKTIFERYLLMLGEYNVTSVETFRHCYPYLAIQRNLQILGAFSYLTKIMKKGYFETYIPRALKSLNELLNQVTDAELSPLRELTEDIPPLRKTLDRHDAEE
jgi:aminoglycoside/choline kinase family phosphotransferase